MKKKDVWGLMAVGASALVGGGMGMNMTVKHIMVTDNWDITIIFLTIACAFFIIFGFFLVIRGIADLLSRNK